MRSNQARLRKELRNERQIVRQRRNGMASGLFKSRLAARLTQPVSHTRRASSAEAIGIRTLKRYFLMRIVKRRTPTLVGARKTKLKKRCKSLN